MKFTTETWIFIVLFFILFGGFLARYYVVGYGVGSGGEYYYSQVVSLALDGDIDITNQMQQVPSLQHANSSLHYEKTVIPYKTKTGLTAICYSIGPAIMWAPFFLLGHTIVIVSNALGAHMLTNGFSAVEQIITMLGSILYATVGLYLIYKFASMFFRKQNALIATLALTFGFATLQYVMIEPSIAHALTLFTVSLFIYYFYLSRNNHSWTKYIVLGVLGGWMMLTKWQEGFFFLLPLIYFIREFLFGNINNDWREPKILLIAKGFVMCLVTFIVFIPQLLVWKAVNGGYFSFCPEAIQIMNFSHPQIFAYLFGWQHSLIATTPIILLALIGAYFFFKKSPFFAFSLVSMLGLLIYVNSSLSEFGGNAFGARRFIDCMLIFVLFLSALLERLDGTKWKDLLFGVISLLVVWNLVYFLQYNLNLINRTLAVTPGMLIENIPKIIPTIVKLL